MAWSHKSWALFGIPIHIDKSWLLVVTFVTWSLARQHFPFSAPGLSAPVYWAMGAIAALLLFACVLLHEMGHALTAKGFGIPVAGVTLFIFGGVAQIRRESHHPLVEVTVALAGPVVSTLIAGSCFALARTITLQSQLHLVIVTIARYLALVNMVLICFNLLPGFPLDGGRIVRAALWGWTGNLQRATRIASGIGTGLGVGLFIFGIWAITRGAWVDGVWYLLLGAFLRDAALASYRHAAFPDSS